MIRFWCQGAADSHSSFVTQKEEGCHKVRSHIAHGLWLASTEMGYVVWSALDQNVGKTVKVNLQGPTGNKESGLVRDSKDSPKHEGVKRKGMNDCKCAGNIVFNVCLSICLSFCLSVCPSVRPSVCLSDLIFCFLFLFIFSSLTLSYLISSCIILILPYPSVYRSIYPLQYPVCHCMSKV